MIDPQCETSYSIQEQKSVMADIHYFRHNDFIMTLDDIYAKKITLFLYETRTTIVISNGRRQIYFFSNTTKFINYHLSNTIYPIPFIKYHFSNTTNQIPFNRYHLSNTIYHIPFFLKWMNQSINRVFLEQHICH